MVSPLTIDVMALKAMGEPLVLDVREDWERDIAALNGSVNIPLQKLPEQAAQLPKDRQIVVMCHHGGRSARATAWLRENGYEAINLEGGIDAWAAQVDPAIARY